MSLNKQKLVMEIEFSYIDDERDDMSLDEMEEAIDDVRICLLFHLRNDIVKLENVTLARLY